MQTDTKTPPEPSPTVQIATKRFGTISVGADEQFDVPRGIPGFAQLRRAVLLAAAKADADTDAQSLFWLQDLDDGDLAFLCVVPWDLFPDYDLEIDEEEFGIGGSVDVRVLNLVTVRGTEKRAPLTVNLRAPIIIDIRRRQMFQTILSDQRWPISAPVASVGGAINTGDGV
jgi:flagellar assembly factor FliW